MALPQIDENAGWLAGIIFTASILWKVWLRLKADQRNDKAATREHDAEGNVIGGYDQLIKQLRAEVERLAKDIDEEREARYTAEKRSYELQRRVEILENRLHELGQSL